MFTWPSKFDTTLLPQADLVFANSGLLIFYFLVVGHSHPHPTASGQQKIKTNRVAPNEVLNTNTLWYCDPIFCFDMIKNSIAQLLLFQIYLFFARWPKPYFELLHGFYSVFSYQELWKWQYFESRFVFCISRYSFIYANGCTNSAANVEITARNVFIIFAFVVSLYN